MTERTPSEKSKGTDAPKCKVCGIRHWGVCADHAARGAISSQAPTAAGRAASSRPAGVDRLQRSIPTSPPKPKRKAADAPAAPAVTSKKKRGRPKTGTYDKAAYDREYAARKRREKAEAKHGQPKG